MASPLAGQVALVTGATRGLGRELAVALASAGADVAIIGRDADDGEATAREVREHGRVALVLAVDVTDQDAMDGAARRAVERFAHVDILVCAAGIGLPRRPIWENGAEDFRACFDVNVLGVMLAFRSVLPHMVERRNGRVVVIGGTYGHKGVANFGIYAASKWALRGLTKSAALESGAHGITVNLISPGGVAGERLMRQFQKSADANGEPIEAVLNRFVSGSALKRLVSGQDIAAALLHLVGEGGRNITGQDIIVDSGTVV